MGATDGAPEEHGGRPLAQASQEALKLAFVVVAIDAQVRTQLIEGFGMLRQLGVPDFTHEGPRVVAVDEPVSVFQPQTDGARGQRRGLDQRERS